MKQSIDKIDEKILSELRANSRVAHAELAGRVNLSRNAVRQRIDRLERHGLIGGYTIIEGHISKSRQRMIAMIFVERHDRMRGSDVLQAIRGIEEVVSCDVMSGDFDLVLRVEASEADRIRLIWQQISALPGVKDTVTAFALTSLIDRQKP